MRSLVFAFVAVLCFASYAEAGVNRFGLCDSRNVAVFRVSNYGQQRIVFVQRQNFSRQSFSRQRAAFAFERQFSQQRFSQCNH